MKENDLSEPTATRTWSLLVFGTLLLMTPVGLAAWLSPDVFSRAQLSLRVAAALGGALIGTILPGALRIKLPGIEAAGALAVFYLIYSVNPPKLGVDLGTTVASPSPFEPRPSNLGTTMPSSNPFGPPSSNSADTMTKGEKLEEEKLLVGLGTPPEAPTEVVPATPVAKRPVRANQLPRPSSTDVSTLGRVDFRRRFSHGYETGTWHVIVRSPDSEAAAITTVNAFNTRFPDLWFDESQSNPGKWMVTLGSGIGLGSATSLQQFARSLPDFHDAYAYCWGFGSGTEAIQNCKK